jgi:hypothetical protein
LSEFRPEAIRPGPTRIEHPPFLGEKERTAC